MSEHNPFDDEEEFIEQTTDINSIPKTSTTTKSIGSKERLISDITRHVNEYFGKKHLSCIAVEFEFLSDDGYFEHVTTEYYKEVVE